MMRVPIRLLALAATAALVPSCQDGGGGGSGSGSGPLWPPNTLIPACADSNSQQAPEMVTDGAGGVIIVWIDSRNLTSWDLYAQRIDRSGSVRWTADGVSICTAVGDQLNHKVAPDGAGGAIIVWQDHRGGGWDIYAQRVNASGAAVWAVDGVSLCTAAGDQGNPQIVPGGSGGAVLTWLDGRSGSTHGIYAQRVSSGGIAQWTVDGVVLCDVAHIQSYPRIAPDGSGGGIVTWNDRRGGMIDDVYAQRVNGMGSSQWTTNGLLLCAATERQFSPEIVSDAAGGAIVVWEDLRGGSYDVYAQRVTGLGALLWGADGLALCTAAGNQYTPMLLSDGSGGALVTWTDGRSGTGFDVYVQKASSVGAVQWTTDGVALCTAIGDQASLQIESDGSGGAILVWEDLRGGTAYEVYARRINGGAALGPANGVALLSIPHVLHFPKLLPDGAGGAIVVWSDARSGNNDLFAQRVDAVALE